MNRTTLMAALLVALAAACEQKPKADPKPEPTPASTVQAARGTETTPANVNTDQAILDQVPVQEDFEQQAALEITPDNLNSEIDKLEKEVAEP